MTVHLVKLCVGAETVDDLERWVERRVAYNKSRGLGPVHDHVTRMFPRRREDLLAGGSLYWVIKGVILCRHKIIDLKPVTGDDGIERCAILMEPPLVLTEAQPKRAFQGWRYLRPEDAPRDVTDKSGAAPAALRAELADLGLL